MKTTSTFMFLLYAFTSFAQGKYPSTKTVDSTHTYFGTTYKDQYEWLENFKDSTVVTWFKQQADYSNASLNKINGRDALIAEWKMLDKLQSAHINGRTYEKGRIFYRKTMPGENVGKLYYRDSLKGAEYLLFDPTNYIKGKALTIESFTPSFDAKQIAIAYSENGAEVSTIKIMDISSRQFLADEIFPSGGLQGFSFDNKAILYTALKTADNADPTARLNTKTKLHLIGTNPKDDKDFFSNASAPELNIEAKAYTYIALTEDNENYIFAGLSTVQPEFTLYYAPIAQFNSDKIQWKVLCKPEDKLVRGFEIDSDKVYAISHDGAENFKLVATDLNNVDWKNAKVIAAEKSDQTLEYTTHCKDYLFEVYSDGINNHVFKYNFTTGQTSEIKLPLSGTVSLFCLNNKTNNCTVGISSWIKPYAGV